MLWCICPLFWKSVVFLQTHNHLPETSHPMDIKTLTYLYDTCVTYVNIISYLQYTVLISCNSKRLFPHDRGWRIVLVLYHQCIYKIMLNSHFNKLPTYKPFKMPEESSSGLYFIVKCVTTVHTITFKFHMRVKHQQRFLKKGMSCEEY